MYKAKICIGDYKEGDIVPDEKAKVWEVMYKESPVIFIDSLVQEEEPVVEEEKEAIEEPESEVVSVWLDDYLNRNSSVVIKNIREDNILSKDLRDMLIIEKNNKNRKIIIKFIKRLIRERD